MKAPRSTFTERSEGRARLTAQIRAIEKRIKQRRADRDKDDQPTAERRPK